MALRALAVLVLLARVVAADPTADRAMLVLQYLVAAIAVVAAALLALVH